MTVLRLDKFCFNSEGPRDLLNGAAEQHYHFKLSCGAEQVGKSAAA